MIKYIIFLLFLLLGFSRLHGSNREGFPLSLTDQEVSATVNGCVNVVGGHLIFAGQDLVLPGAESLTLERFHAACFSFINDIHGCFHNHESKILTYPDHNNRTVALHMEPSGSCLYFFEFKGHSGLLLAHEWNKYGLTNCGSGFLNAHTNLKNNTLANRNNEMVAVNGADCERTYQYIGKGIHRIKSEIRPNGNRLDYSYQNGKLHRVETKNARGNVIFNSLTYQIPHLDDCVGNPWITVTGSDDRVVQYKLQHFKVSRARRKIGHTNQIYVSEVISPEQPWEKFTYVKPTNNEWEDYRVSSRIRPDDRFIQIEYYMPGHNDVGGEARGWPKFHGYPVKCLKEPVGTDATPIITYRFFYDMQMGDGGLLKRPGSTDVRDAYNHKVCYDFSQQECLTAIRKFEGRNSHTAYSVERFFWGAENTPDCSFLLAKTLETVSGCLLKAISLEYDPRGNVLAERLYGNLTGINFHPIQMQPNGPALNNGCDCYIKQSTHSDCKKNLLLTEEDDRKKITYSYQPGTNLPLSKFLSDGSGVKLREFYVYDPNGVQTKKIVDDGVSEDSESLSGVTERRVTYTQPRTTYPIGLPQVVEERCLDLKSGAEKLVRKIVNHHDLYGRIVQQDHYDAAQEYAYSLFWEYDPQGNLMREIDALGQATLRRYDQNKNLIYVQGPRTDYHLEYVYDQMNRLIREEEIRQDGTRLTKSYRYDYLGNLVVACDWYGNETEFVYDAFGREIARISPSVLNGDGVPIRPTARKSYDEMGNITSETDACGHTTTRAYTAYGKPYLTTYADGTRESITYNLQGDEIRFTAKNGAYTVRTLDYQARTIKKQEFSSTGQLLRTEESFYNAFHLLREIDSNGGVKEFAYDAAGRLTERRNNERRTLYLYDTLSRLEETRDYFGEGENDYISTIQKHDPLNRVIQYCLSSPTTGMTFKEEYDYDADNHRTSSKTFGAAGEAEEHRTYDPHGQIIRQIYPDGGEIFTQHCYQYGHKYVEILDPLLQRTAEEYDALGRLTATTRYSPAGIEIQHYTIFYDAIGNPSRRVEAVFPSGRMVTTRWIYSPVYNLIALHQAAGSNEEKITFYRYDASGALEQIIKPNGGVIRHEYDPLKRLVHFFADDQSFDYLYSYDNLDNIITVEDKVHGAFTRRSYDLHRRLTCENLSNGLQVKYSYDRLGRLVKLILPDESQIQQSYRGSLVDKILRLSKTNEILYTHAQTAYDLSGKLLKAQLIGNAGELNYHYDLMQRPVDIFTHHWSEGGRTYDLTGHLRSRWVKDSQGSAIGHYGYDDLYQLIHESGLAQNQYAYDSLYNRVEKNHQGHLVNDLNQLCEDGQTSYRYNANGALASKGNAHYTYDLNDRLTAITYLDRRVEYTYDAFHRRLSKRAYIQTGADWELDSTENYFYLHQLEIGSTDSETALTSLKVMAVDYPCEKGRTVAIEHLQQAYAAIQDANGSIVALVDPATGQLSQEMRYSAFGEEQNTSSSLACPWRFASMRTDPESGFVYFGQRYYDPSTGRWITPDPIVSGDISDYSPCGPCSL